MTVSDFVNNKFNGQRRAAMIIRRDDAWSYHRGDD